MTTLESKRGPLTGGFLLMCRNWRCLTWTWLFNFLLAGIATLPLFGQTSALLDHSMAAKKISGLLDLATVGGAFNLMNERPTGLTGGSVALDICFVLLLLLFTPAVISIYLGDELGSLGNLFRVGFRYLWRMVRLGLVFLIVGGIPLGLLMAVRGAMLAKLDNTYIERSFFFWELGTGLVVLLLAIVVRLWFDLSQLMLVERGTYRIGRVESRSAWKAIGPAWRLLSAGLLQLVVAFAVIDVIGIGLLVLAVLAWRLMPPSSVLAAFLLGLIGLFLLLSARFWQRGLEVQWFAANQSLVVPPVVPLVAPTVPVYVEEKVVVVTEGPTPAPIDPAPEAV
jgi:hypothetical protein